MAEHNSSGSWAEKTVCEYLKKHGFLVVDTNWKTKWCEIDIIASKDDCLHFVEVKYRARPAQGSGFDYVTPKKLNQMKRAADSWVEINDWEGEYVLSAADVSGEDFYVEFIEQV